MKTRSLLCALILLGLGAAWAGVPARVSQRGWAPLVALAGEGDAYAATAQLRSGLAVFHSLLHGLDMDEETSSFLGALRGSLDSFDLSGFHESLPEQDGAWRRLRVSGQHRGTRFVVRQGGERECRVRPDGPLGATLGDLGVEVRAKPIHDSEGDVANYLMRAELGLGVGPISWGALTESLAETARLFASGDPRSELDPGVAPTAATRSRLRATHPTLRREDLDALAVLWESFPKLGDVLMGVARAEDVLVFDPKGTGDYHQLRLSARLRPDLMEERYEELAEFLTDLGSLAKVQVTWVDPQGRQLASFSFETKTLRLTFGCFVKDGRLLPVSNGVVVTEAEAGSALGEPSTFRGVVDLVSEINGISTRIHGLEVDWTHTEHASGADLSARIARTPKVSMSGRAFGILPTWAIDVLIPGDMDALTREFLGVACAGNEGQGIAFDLRARQARGGGPGTLTASGGVEVLDSLLVSIAMRVASLKLLPDEDVRAEIGALLVEVERAFRHDLERFAALSQPGARRR